jgi:probable HAF family extracellular repeat protein
VIPALGICCVFAAATAQTYTVTDLGTLRQDPTSTTYPAAIDEAGEITGHVLIPDAATGTSVSAAFLYRDGKMEAIAGENSSGNAIATGPRVAGTTTFPGATTSHPFLYQDHFLRDLGSLPGGTEFGASGVNARGEVVGSGTSNGQSAGFLYSRGNMISLGVAVDYASSEAVGINNKGDVAGTFDGFENNGLAFLYQDGTFTTLGVLPGAGSSFATAINDADQIAGSSYNSSFLFEHAFLWSKGQMQDLGLLPNGVYTEAYALNNAGQVVGQATIQISGGFTEAAFLYSDGKMIDLNTLIPADSGWALYMATGINARGQIVGSGVRNGVSRGFLLNPDCRDQKNKDCGYCRHQR